MRTGFLYFISLCQCVCVKFVGYTDCESYAKYSSTNPASMEAGEYGLTRGMCFVACRLEVVAVGGLLWNSWCVLGGARFGFHFGDPERSSPARSRRNDSPPIFPPRTRRSPAGLPFIVLPPEKYSEYGVIG